MLRLISPKKFPISSRDVDNSAEVFYLDFIQYLGSYALIISKRLVSFVKICPNRICGDCCYAMVITNPKRQGQICGCLKALGCTAVHASCCPGYVEPCSRHPGLQFFRQALCFEDRSECPATGISKNTRDACVPWRRYLPTDIQLPQ